MNIKSICFSAALLLACSFLSAQTEAEILKNFPWAKDAGAHSFPKLTKEFKVADFGAKNDGVTLNTKAIQAAIDACAAQGGGIVSFAAGKYLTGSVFVKKNVNLFIGKDVTILGSQNIADYPVIATRAAGIELNWPAALLNIIDQDNAAITGEGLINAQGKVFWDKYKAMRDEYNPKGLRWIVDYDCQRARTILVQNSTNVSLKGFTIHQAGFWSVQVVYSKYVTVAGITIRNNIDGKGPSTDGVDIDSSSFVVVEGCDIDCNDDDYCLKAGRDADGLRVGRPCEYVIIRNSTSRSGGGTLVCGSETSGFIKHILAYNMKAIRSSSAVRLKSAITRGGGVDDINVYNFEMDSVMQAVGITMNWNPKYSYSELPSNYKYDEIPAHWKVMLTQVKPEQGIPQFRNVHITGLKGTTRRVAFEVEGMKESLAENFTFKNVDISTEKRGRIEYARNWKFENVKITATDTSRLKIANCEKVDF